MAELEDVHLPDDLWYDPEEHLWVRPGDGFVEIGLDELGRWAAGTISYVNLNPPGKRVTRRGAAIGSLEANKFVGPVKAPVRGVVSAVNEAVLESPRWVQEDPYGRGWFVKVEPTHLREDLEALVHGVDAVARYLEARVREYRERGILPEEPSLAARRPKL